MITLTIPAMITFGVFLIAMVMIGVMTHGETSTFEDFTVGGRRSPPRWPPCPPEPATCPAGCSWASPAPCT